MMRRLITDAEMQRLVLGAPKRWGWQGLLPRPVAKSRRTSANKRVEQINGIIGK
jgi:hypothetical protein